MSDSDKQALLDGTATIQTEIEIINEGGTNTILTENNSVIDWNHEDFRQVKEEGFIGQFIARQLTGNLHNLADDFKITDKELILRLGVRTNDNTNWYSLGNFIVTKVSDDEVKDKTSFEALDYTKKFNKEYVDTIEYPCTALQLAQNVCNQCGVTLGSSTFRNYDYIIDGNVFTNNESCRDVMKAIGKLAFSWVRVDWDNKVYIDFDPTPFTDSTVTPSSYNTFGNNKYYNLKTQKEVYGPVDKVIIGYSAIDGERTFIGDENGSCEITVYDNPLVFNQTQRASVISAANDLLGMTYTPLNTLTVGHPWLKGNEKVRVTDMENVSHDTLPLDRTIQYFGHIKTLINSSTQTKTNDTLAYKPEMAKNYERSEIYNDQINKQIGIIIESQSNMDSRLNSTISTLDGTIQRVSATETSITDIVTTTQSSIGKNSLYLEDAMEQNVINYSVDGVSEQETREGKNRVNRISETLPKTIISPATGYTSISIFYDDKFVSNYQKNSLSKAVFTSFALNTGWTKRAGYSQFTKRTKDGFDIYETYITNTDFTLIDNHRFVMIFEDHDQTTGCDLYDVEVDLGNTIGQDFEEYGESPSPDYPSEIKNISSIINLFNKDNANIINGFLSDGGTLNSDNIWKTLYMPCKPNTTYTISKISSKAFRVADFQNIPQIGATYIHRTRNDTATTITFTTDNNGNYLAISYYRETDTLTPIEILDTIMIEEGTVAHEYIPYGYWSRVKITGKNLFDKENTNWYRTNNSAFYDTSNNSTNRIRTSGFGIDGGKTYTLSGIPNGITLNSGGPKCYDANQNYLGDRYVLYSGNSFTLPNDVKYIAFLFNGENFTNDTNTLMKNANIQLEEGTTATPYEPYKEKEVLIDMSKPNLFDKDNANILSNTYLMPNNGTITQSGSGLKILYIPITGGNTYTIHKKIGKVFRVATCIESPTIGVSTYQGYQNDTSSIDKEDTYTITTNSDSNYLLLNYYRGSGPTEDYTEQKILDSITIFEGTNSTPYYELCSNKDKTVKDRLLVDTNGNCSITKYIGKRVFNGSETIDLINSNTDNWYYKITTNNPTANQLTQLCSHYENKGIYNGNTDNGIMLTNNGLETRIRFGTQDTVNNYKNWLSNNNVTLQYELATPETITLPNTKIPLFEGINHITFVDDLETDTSVVYYRKTPLSDTYATTRQLNDVSVEKTQEIQTVRQEVITEINKESLRIDVVRQEIDETGVPILNTGTGYTFDIDGLKMEKTDQDVKSQLDNDGLSVKYKNEDVLTARSNGVNAVNMTVNKFYIQKPIRMEKTNSITDSTKSGLGFFYIGE